MTDNIQNQEEVRSYTLDATIHKRNKCAMFFYHLIKRIFDIFASIIGLIVSLPLLLIFSIIIKVQDGGKVFYSHERIGYKGKPLNIIKFRTMVENSQDLEALLTEEQLRQYNEEFKIDDDPRITKFGKFLRKTSLDELPQLLKVFDGSLSLIGPRPILDYELEKYDNAKEKFLSVKPGLTGYWQTYARNDVTYVNGERQKMELYYVDNCSLWFDIKIFFKTIISVIKKTGH